jgi:hypothetical protein
MSQGKNGVGAPQWVFDLLSTFIYRGVTEVTAQVRKLK